MTLKDNVYVFFRMQPPERVKTLLRFAERVQKTPEVGAELKKFNMEMNTELVNFTGRVLPAEKVTAQKEFMPHQADWTQGENLSWMSN